MPVYLVRTNAGDFSLEVEEECAITERRAGPYQSSTMPPIELALH